jgi:hypothetical protein
MIAAGFVSRGNAMARPQFTPEEAALIAQLRAPADSGIAFASGYLVPSGLLVAFGFARDEPAAFAAAFAVIATFTIWSLRYQQRGAATLRSILQKYEAAAADDDA